MASQHLAISADFGSGFDRSGWVMKMASNSGCSRSPVRKTLNIASCTAVRCPQRYSMRFLPRATTTNSCSSLRLKHREPRRGLRPVATTKAQRQSISDPASSRRLSSSVSSCVLLQIAVKSQVRPARKACFRSDIVALPPHLQEGTSAPRSV